MPATAVLNSSTADLISSHILQISPIRNIWLNSLDQEKANLMASHINSQPKENLKGKSPLEMMEFLSPDLYKKFIEFGIKKLENDEIILKPYLLKEDN